MLHHKSVQQSLESVLTVRNMATYQVKAVGIKSQGSKFEKITVGRGQIGDSDVDFDIKYCGLCHSDIYFVRTFKIIFSFCFWLLNLFYKQTIVCHNSPQIFNFFPFGSKKNLFGSGQKVPGSKTGWPLIYCGSKACLGWVGLGRVRSGTISNMAQTTSRFHWIFGDKPISWQKTPLSLSFSWRHLLKWTHYEWSLVPPEYGRVPSVPTLQKKCPNQFHFCSVFS